MQRERKERKELVKKNIAPMSLINRLPPRAGAPSPLQVSSPRPPRHYIACHFQLQFLIAVWYLAGVICVLTTKYLLTTSPKHVPSGQDEPQQSALSASVTPTLLTFFQLSVSCIACNIYLRKCPSLTVTQVLFLSSSNTRRARPLLCTILRRNDSPSSPSSSLA